MQTSMPIILVDEGKFVDKNLKKTGKSADYFRDILRSKGYTTEKRLLVMTVDGNGKLYFQARGKKYETHHLAWEESLW